MEEIANQNPPEGGTQQDQAAVAAAQTQAQATETKLPPTALTGGDPDAPAEGDKPDTTENQSPALPEQPEGYKLNFAEGVKVDTELLGQFRKTAHELGLTVPQAQKVADLYAGHIAGLSKKFEEAQFKAINDYIEARNAELSQRPNFKEEVVLARKTLKEFGSQELADVLQQTAMGSHPALFDFMVKVGRALGEPAFRGGGGAPGQETALHERVWGKDGLGPQG